MKEKFLKNPNLPQGKVTTVFANIDDIALENVFNNLAIKVVNATQNELLDAPISLHADVLANYVGNDIFLADYRQQELFDFVESAGGEVKKINNIQSPYPNECLLNFADIGDYIICNKSILTQEIIETLPYKQIIDVKQGYSKCSVCIAKRNTIITDDSSIFKAASQYKDIKLLYIEKGSIQIEKYYYGFIGGCCGLIDEDLLLFNGDLLRHSDFDKIKKFLYDNDIRYIDIKGKPLTDIGSIIPIMEKRW